MALTDPIADFLTRIRNAKSANHRWVDIPPSNVKKRIALVLRREGYISDAVIIDDGKQQMLRIFLKYDKEGKCTIDGLKRVSTPGRRVYVSSKNIPRVRNGLGIAVLSTPEGVITGVQARKKNIGGEVLCEIW